MIKLVGLEVSFSPTCLSLANFHHTFPPNRMITKRTVWQVFGSGFMHSLNHSSNMDVKKLCRKTKLISLGWSEGLWRVGVLTALKIWSRNPGQYGT